MDDFLSAELCLQGTDQIYSILRLPTSKVSNLKGMFIYVAVFIFTLLLVFAHKTTHLNPKISRMNEGYVLFVKFDSCILFDH